jgi:peptidoglycan hydrolase-like protein with peptidoglycan-binding domain
MGLKSILLRNDAKLDACLIQDSAHVTVGATGEHVAKIQTAVSRLDGYRIDFAEVRDRRYGRSTATAVLAYKRKRKIINRSYETQADDIVGKMTIASLDREIAELERLPRRNKPRSWDIG